jgi:calpain
LGIRRGPQMFEGATDRFDINQGEIGNCWFLAALANLVENKRCFNLVVPQRQSFDGDYCGLFRFRFWRFGEWVEVVVDDRLPTRNGKLIYLR